MALWDVGPETGQWLGQIPNIIQGAGTLFNLFSKRKSSKEIPALGQLAGLTNAQTETADAIANPNSAMAKQVSAMLLENRLADMAGGLRDLFSTYNRMRARGLRVGNPERQDESIARAWLEARNKAGSDAQLQAIQYLQSRLAGLQGASAGAQAQIQPQQAYADLEANRKAAMPGALGNLAGGVIRTIFGPMPATPAYYSQNYYNTGNFGVGSQNQYPVVNWRY